MSTERSEKPKGKELEMVACKTFNEPYKQQIKYYCKLLELNDKTEECVEKLFTKCLRNTYHITINPKLFLGAAIYLSSGRRTLREVCKVFETTEPTLRLYNKRLCKICEVDYTKQTPRFQLSKQDIQNEYFRLKDQLNIPFEKRLTSRAFKKHSKYSFERVRDWWLWSEFLENIGESEKPFR